MIEPNFHVFLWLLLILIFSNAIAKVGVGSFGVEKEEHYGKVEILSGLIDLIVVILVVVL